MRYISWNVNGLRSALKKGFADFAAEADPDILCLQETRAEPHQVELEMPGRCVYWNPARRKGYSGTTIFTRIEPMDVRTGLGDEDLDGEGRVLTLEFAGHFLVNVYTPNSQRELARLPHRQKWDIAFLAHLKELEKSKPVVCCGDLNVSHQEIDLANPRSNRRNAGFTDEERAGFSAFLEAGFIDTFRELNPGREGCYTWWSYRSAARERNVGWRLDYFLISGALRPRLAGAEILADVHGSDHCPVALDLDWEAGG